MRRNAREFRFLATGLLLAGSFAIQLAGCSDDDGGTDPARDTTPPVVVEVSPSDGSADVSLNTAVTVTFSEGVEPTSCTSQSVRLSGGVTGTVQVNGDLVTFTPSGPLAPLTEYDVTVTTGICDMAGNAMAQAFDSSFTTSGRPVADPGDDFYVGRGEMATVDASHSSGTSGGPLTYRWTQEAGPMVQALSGANPGFQAPNDVTTLVFSLVVVDDGVESDPARVRIMVLEDPDHAFFVHKSGSDQGSGTQDDPFVTIQRAINAAHSENAGGDVYIAAGDFAGSLQLAGDVSLYGGFNAATWERDATELSTRILGGATAIHGVDVHDLVLDRLAIESDDADEFGGSSIGILLDACTGLELTRSRVRAGDGMHGLPGDDGPDGSPGAKGSNGSARSGGAGAAGPGMPGGNGGTGGFDWESGGSGHAGQPAGEGGGAAGSGGSYNGRGGNGGNGADAPALAGDGPGGPSFGAWVGGAYVTGTGATGEQIHGAGGGGGGGGGAEGVYNGGGGGGGGAGGEGGYGGEGGQGGGASIAIALYGGSDVAIRETVLATGGGGNGGWGGEGGEGAAGGTGGGSGAPQSDGFWLEGEHGGTGGTGGHGAHGGYGGGGGGGPVVGILCVQSQCARTGLGFQLGAPGNGGQRPDGKGLTGSTGESAEYKSMI